MNIDHCVLIMVFVVILSGKVSRLTFIFSVFANMIVLSVELMVVSISMVVPFVLISQFGQVIKSMIQI